MECYKHQDREAIATCSVCGKPICSECYIEIAGSPYCKDCVNSIVTQNIMKSANKEKETIESIEPITKPQTIPYEEKEEEIISSNKKDPENYQPEYDYETEYVETYDDEDNYEDSYYENPERIPEPQPEYIEKRELNQQRENAQEYYNDRNNSNHPSNNLETKYERYLEDLYYDEAPNYNNQLVNENEHYNEEPIYENNKNYPNEQIYQDKYINDDYIVPIHQSGNKRNSSNYEEIKRKIEAENNNPRDYVNNFPNNSNENYFRRRGNENLEDIQRMHYENNNYNKNDNSFTTVEMLLTIILIVLIIIVAFYIIYLFALSNAYPSVTDAVMGLIQNPGLFLSNLIN